jgi:peptidoglycan/xylan/chitin deacetylase (PgdA/CDA1 family)
VNDQLVLCYHAVSPTWPADLSLPADRFEAQLRALLDRGYRGVTFSEATSPDGRGQVFAVTFDDAYRSVIELAYPILSRLGLPATVFAPTDFIGSERPMAWPGIDRWLGGAHEHELTPMGADELGTLLTAGWEIGSHTRSHPRLTSLPDDALQGELEGSRARLEELLSSPCRSLAYPFGDVDARVVRAARMAGYARAATLVPYPWHPHPLLWPRVGVYHVDSPRRFALKVSPLARRARLALARQALMGLARRR